MGYRERNNNNSDHCPGDQKHVHELQGSVRLAGSDPHGHRFCTITCEAMPYNDNNHIHEVKFMTDFYDDHYHEFCGKTGCAIPVGDRHVHYIESVTSVNDGHRHSFEAATMIENPTGMDHKRMDCDYRKDSYHKNDFYRR